MALCWQKLLPLLDRLHDVGCERDKAGNRKLHMDQSCLLVPRGALFLGEIWKRARDLEDFSKIGADFFQILSRWSGQVRAPKGIMERRRTEKVEDRR